VDRLLHLGVDLRPAGVEELRERAHEQVKQQTEEEDEVGDLPE